MTDEPDSMPQAAPLDDVGRLMQEILESADGSSDAAVERACAAHPALADELRRRFVFLRAVGLDAAPLPPAPERLGDFEPLERIAGGGMGLVYRARQLSLDRIVALKLVRPELLYFDGSRERFRREAETIARLEHPGVVPVYAAGEEQGVPYIAMQLVEGRTLAEVVAQLTGRAPETLRGVDLLAAVRSASNPAEHGEAPAAYRRGWTHAVAAIVRDVARALEHAHQRGVFHRDIKPSNVLLSIEGRAQLIDFGLTGSSAPDSLTRAGARLGTPHYMAPERWRGERDSDGRADVYSAGVTLYELLALQAPFRAETSAELEQLVLDGRVEGLRTRNRAVDADLERVCLQAMAIEPSRRYASAAAFADDLDRWLVGAPVLARSPGVVERGVRWVRRHRAASTAMLLAALLLIGVPTSLYVLQRRHSRELERSLESERAALADMRVANEVVTRVLRDASPAHADGRQVTLYESVGKMAELAASGDDSPRARAQVLSMIGQIYSSHSEYDKAERWLRDALQRLSSPGLALGKEYAIAAEALGHVLKARGELEGARERYREAARVAEAAGLGDNWKPEMLAHEAATYMRTTPDAAAKLLREALGAFRADPRNSDDREWLKRNRLRLAQLEGVLGDPAKGLALLDEVRAEIARQAAPSLRDKLELAVAESELAFATRDFERADRVLSEAVETARGALGEKNNSVAQLLFQLGRARFELGELDDARQRMDEALRLRREVTGVDSAASQQLEASIRGYFPEPTTP